MWCFLPTSHFNYFQYFCHFCLCVQLVIFLLSADVCLISFPLELVQLGDHKTQYLLVSVKKPRGNTFRTFLWQVYLIVNVVFLCQSKSQRGFLLITLLTEWVLCSCYTDRQLPNLSIVDISPATWTHISPTSAL